MRRLLVWIGIGAAALVAAPFTLMGLWLGWGLLIDNPGYAKRYFADLFEVAEIVASRRWHGLGAEPFDCSYAVALLPRNAADAPGARPRHGARAFHMGWGGDWQETPALPLSDTTRDAVDACARYFPAEINERIDRALSQAGSLYIRGPVGETVYIYSVPHRIAARIRYGD